MSDCYFFFIHVLCVCVSRRYRELQSKAESRVSDVRNELKVKGFEAERSQMMYEETVKNLKDSEMEVEKLQQKAEVCDLGSRMYALRLVAALRGETWAFLIVMVMMVMLKSLVYS